MALDTNTKLAIQARLRLGSAPKEVAVEFDTNLSTVYAINKAIKAEMKDDALNSIHTIPNAVVTHIVEEAKKDAKSIPVAKAFEEVTAGIDRLKKLDKSFQTTMTNVLNRFDTMLQDEDLGLGGMIQISNATALAYEKMFSAGTNIHIGDNNSQSNNQLTVFQNKKGI